MRVNSVLGKEDATAKSPFIKNSAPLRLWLKSRVYEAEENGSLQTKRKASPYDKIVSINKNENVPGNIIISLLAVGLTQSKRQTPT